jgi:hypothetical protein
LIGAAALAQTAILDSDPTATTELLQRIQASDTSPATLESLQTAVVELCCAYSSSPALALRTEAHGWLKRVASMLRKPVGLTAHRELMVSAGWLALLTGCLEFDLGMSASAQATRRTAEQLGREVGHPAISGWALEMSAWFALTGGRYRQAVEAAERGLALAGRSPVVAQLHAQRAKSLARLGDVEGVRQALESAQRHVDSAPIPDRPDNHFEVDPAKLELYATDAYRMVGADALAERHARAVIEASTLPGGTLRQPMRVSEAELTLSAVSARRGDLDGALTHGLAGLTPTRRSLPELLLVAGEVQAELNGRYPDEPITRHFRDAIRSLSA